jgi:hypothetical protein
MMDSIFWAQTAAVALVLFAGINIYQWTVSFSELEEKAMHFAELATEEGAIPLPWVRFFAYGLLPLGFLTILTLGGIPLIFLVIPSNAINCLKWTALPIFA